MKRTISTGQACVKFLNVALNDNSSEKEISDLMTPAELILFENKILLRVTLSASEHALEELWEVGIDNEMNSSVILEPFGIEVIATNDEEFLIKICASKVVKNPDEVNEWLTIVIIAKFKSVVPSQLINSNNFFSTILMILDQIKQQECDRWYLNEVLYDRLVYRTNLVSDPFAAIEIVLKKGDPNKAYVLYKGEDNKAGMELFFQKEISIDSYLSLADGMSDMMFDFII